MSDLNKPRSLAEAQWVAHCHNIQKHDSTYEAEAVKLPQKKPSNAELYVIECFICNPSKDSGPEQTE